MDDKKPMPVPKWFLAMIAVAVLLIGGSMASEANTERKQEARNAEGVGGVICRDSMGRTVTADDKDDCETRWQGEVVD